MTRPSIDLAEIIDLQQQVVTSTSSLDELMKLICVKTQNLTRAIGAVVEIAEGEDMVYRAVSGMLEKSLGTRLKVSSSLSGLSTIKNEVLYCQDTEVDPRVDRAACQRLGILSMICVPLVHYGKAVGVLKMVSDKKNHFGSEDISVLRLTAGLLSASIGQASDAAEKVKALLNLQKSESKLRHLFEAVTDGIVISKDGLIIDVNPAFLTLFGYEREEIIGKSIGLIVPAENRSSILQDVEQGVTKKLELLCEKKDGTAILVEGTGRTLIINDEKIRMTSMRDITARKTYELALKNSESRALAATKAKSEFLANISHELRTPLNGIMGMAGLLEDTTLNSEQKTYVDIVKSSADNLLSLVNDILDFSKIEAQKLTFEKIPFEVKSALNDIVQLLGPSASKKGIMILSNVDDRVPASIIGDPTRIRQVLLNLVNNAVKFTFTGSVKINILQRKHDQNMSHLRFEIIDTGIGIPPKAIEEMFRPFSQVDASTTRKFGGTGLGLSICKQLVEMMGGKIGVESAEGKGSTFWFEISFEVASVKSQQANETKMDHEQARYRILIAEDNAVNGMIARVMLEKHGHSITLVGNGKEALDALEMAPYDLVLMDCQMPEMDGYEATHRIRNAFDREWNGIPIIAMTANAMAGDREKCLAAGMNSYISKPMKREDLIKEILELKIKK